MFICTNTYTSILLANKLIILFLDLRKQKPVRAALICNIGTKVLTSKALAKQCQSYELTSILQVCV